MLGASILFFVLALVAAAIGFGDLAPVLSGAVSVAFFVLLACAAAALAADVVGSWRAGPHEPA